MLPQDGICGHTVLHKEVSHRRSFAWRIATKPTANNNKWCSIRMPKIRAMQNTAAQSG